jgi:hypothetical protein
MLRAAPVEQLEAIIASTSVAPQQRRALMGKAAAVMLVALSAGLAGCEPVSDGHRPDMPVPHEPERPGMAGVVPAPPKPNEPAQVDPAADTPEQPPAPRIVIGIVADDPPPISINGVRPK